jgi:hypothetical protein
MASPLTSITHTLERTDIVPDVLSPNSFTLTTLFSVIFPSGKEALLGNELVEEDTLEEPSIIFTPLNIPAHQADSSGEGADFTREVTYTLVMTDPDARSR